MKDYRTIDGIIKDTIDRFLVEPLPYKEAEEDERYMELPDIYRFLNKNTKEEYKKYIAALRGIKKQIVETYYLYCLYRTIYIDYDYLYGTINYLAKGNNDEIGGILETEVFTIDYILEIKRVVEENMQKRYRYTTDNKNERIYRVFERDRKAIYELVKYSLVNTVLQ